MNTAAADNTLSSWLSALQDIAGTLPDGGELGIAFAAVLAFIWQNAWVGGCHDTSAVLHMLFKELGHDSHLCIGEVRTPQGLYFDHSWVEVDNRIFDAAISLPLVSGAKAGGPIFSGTDLSTGASTPNQFGYDSGEGLGPIASTVCDKTLEDYARTQSGITIWTLVLALGERIGLKLSLPVMLGKYGDLPRERVVHRSVLGGSLTAGM